MIIFEGERRIADEKPAGFNTNGLLINQGERCQ